MDNFRIIYRILSALERAMDCEEFDPEMISPEAMKCSPERLEKLLIQLQRSGYIDGLTIQQYIRQPETIMPPIQPVITIQGLEYLSDNSMMKKAANLAKGILSATGSVL